MAVDRFGRIDPFFKFHDGDAFVYQARFAGGPAQQGGIGTAVHDATKGKGPFGPIPRGFVLNVVDNKAIAGQCLGSVLKFVANGLTLAGWSSFSRWDFSK